MMKCYHMTTIDRIDSISKLGLIPRNPKISNETISKLINETRVKVFFSEGYEGAIALFIDVNIVYNKIKKGEMPLDDATLYKKVLESHTIRDYLGEGVYLCFDRDSVENENNSVDGCTSKVIEPDKLKVVVLENLKDGSFSYSRFDILHYMMSRILPENINYNGIKWPNIDMFKKHHARTEEEKISVNQNKIRDYYIENDDKIQVFRNNDYQMMEIPLSEFVYFINNKDSLNQNDNFRAGKSR